MKKAKMNNHFALPANRAEFVIGMRFTEKGQGPEKYILAQVEACRYALINLSTGNRFLEPMDEDTMTQLIYDSFEKVQNEKTWSKN